MKLYFWVNPGVWCFLFLFLSKCATAQITPIYAVNRIETIPAAQFSRDNQAKAQRKWLSVPIRENNVSIGDTLLIRITPEPRTRNLELFLKYCYGNCPLDGAPTEGYDLHFANTDTLRNYTWKVPVTALESGTDESQNVRQFDNSALKVIYVYVRNPNRAEARYKMEVFLSKSAVGRDEYPLPVRKMASDLGTAKFHALLVSVNDYDDPAIKLNRPNLDILRLDSVLSKKYEFASIIKLPNATKKMLKDTLTALSYRLLNDDNLILFFAGHGISSNKNGYWAMKDSKADDLDSFFSNAALVSFLDEIHTQHLLVVADACFGATLVRSENYADKVLRTWGEIYAQQSRKAMSSCQLEATPDRSVFLDYFVKRLGENQEAYVSAEELFDRLKNAVHNNTQQNQKPTYGNVLDLRAGAGDFLFKRKIDRPDSPLTGALSGDSSLAILNGEATPTGDTILVSHVKVFTLDAPVPDSTRKVYNGLAGTSVILTNSHAKTASVLFSSNKINWQPYSIPARDSYVYKMNSPQGYVQVKTDAIRSTRYGLVRGKRYKIIWNAPLGMFDLEPIN